LRSPVEYEASKQIFVELKIGLGFLSGRRSREIKGYWEKKNQGDNNANGPALRIA
jgi:hypothetical protein